MKLTVVQPRVRPQLQGTGQFAAIADHHHPGTAAHRLLPTARYTDRESWIEDSPQARENISRPTALLKRWSALANNRASKPMPARNMLRVVARSDSIHVKAAGRSGEHQVERSRQVVHRDAKVPGEEVPARPGSKPSATALSTNTVATTDRPVATQ